MSEPQSTLYHRLARQHPRSRAFIRNVQRQGFWLWSELALVDCPNCGASVVLSSALVHLRVDHGYRDQAEARIRELGPKARCGEVRS